MSHWRKAAINVFGFMWQQPLHVTLRQMRLIQVGLIINSQWLLWEIVGMLKLLDPMQASVALGAIAAALIAQIWTSINSITKSNFQDE